MNAGRRILSRFALLLASLVVAALLGEILLQAGAMLVDGAGRRLDSAFAGDHLRVVCIGDSNTYGLHLERSESYPQQFEKLWNSDPDRPQIEVLNLGFPGTNSSTVRREFPRMLRDLSPQLVLIMVGANDSWTVPATDAASDDLLDRIEAFLHDHSRLYRLYSIARNRSVRHEVVSPKVVSDPTIPRRVGTIEYGDHAYSLGFEGRKNWALGDDRPLARNLQALVAEAEAAGAAVILLTYPRDRGLYASANRWIVEASESGGAPLIDLRSGFSEVCGRTECKELFFPDGHPTASGYALVAQILSSAVDLTAERSPAR